MQNWLTDIYKQDDLLIPLTSMLNLQVHLLMSKLVSEALETHSVCIEKSTSIQKGVETCPWLGALHIL